MKKIIVGGVAIAGLAVGATFLPVGAVPSECVSIDVSSWERVEKQHFKAVSNFLIYQTTGLEVDPTWSVESFEEAQSVEVCQAGADLSFLTGQMILDQYAADRAEEPRQEELRVQVVEYIKTHTAQESAAKLQTITKPNELRWIYRLLLDELDAKQFSTMSQGRQTILKLVEALKI